ncbi:MAG: dTMP kinase [Candidatus Brockarchaeota archaeon]|nr:dTMP kinase [Candidatus Brockarchaeota archaeon]
MRRGVHVSLEGIDGTGKTTQAYLLLNWLRSQGYRAKYTAEPTYGRVGSVIRLHVYRIRKTPIEYEALLFAADRVEHYLKFIKPLLERGWIVVSDRYVHSSIAYQGAALGDARWVREINRFAPPPDLAILIDVPVGKALKRIKRRKAKFEKKEILAKVRREYGRLVESGEMKRVDGSGPVERVSCEIRKMVEELLRNKRLVAKPLPQSAPPRPA